MITLDDFYISSVFQGLSGTIQSRAGYVPQALSTDSGKYLRSDGLWSNVNTNYSHEKIIRPALPPGDEYFDNVSLLLNMEGSNNSTIFKDSSKNNFTVTRYGQARISTDIFKYSSSSGFLPTSGLSYIAAPQNTAFAFPGDFTVEFWIYPLSFTNDMMLFDGCELNGNGVRADTFALLTNTLSGLYIFSNGLTIGTTSITIPGQGWSHIALVRSSSDLTLFINGVSALGIVNSTPFTRGGCVVGSLGDWPGNPTFLYNGYFDGLRITKNIARYTSNFTPPTTAFLNFGYTTPVSGFAPVFGQNTILAGQYSGILGGNNNSLSGNNTFIIGSNLTGIANNTTFLNTVSSTGDIFTKGDKVVTETLAIAYAVAL